MSKETLLETMRKIAGLPLVESWDDDGDDEDPDVKIAMSDKRQAAFEKKKKAADAEEEAKKAAAPKAEEKKEAPASEEKPKAARGSFTAIARPMIAKGASTADIRAALEKAGVSTAHLHSRLAGLRKSVKVAEGYVLTHPQMPSFVLAENPVMNQYQWISEKDDTTTLLPVIFETEAAAAKVKQYVYDYKNQLAVVTPISFGD